MGELELGSEPLHARTQLRIAECIGIEVSADRDIVPARPDGLADSLNASR